MRFNINDTVRVRLTEHGREALRQNTDAMNHVLSQTISNNLVLPYETVKEDREGWSEWQLWHLMQQFGHLMSPAGPMLFEAEIEIPEPG